MIRLTVEGTQTEKRVMAKRRGMMMYCLNERDDDGLRDVWLMVEMVVGVLICLGVGLIADWEQ